MSPLLSTHKHGVRKTFQVRCGPGWCRNHQPSPNHHPLLGANDGCSIHTPDMRPRHRSPEREIGAMPYKDPEKRRAHQREQKRRLRAANPEKFRAAQRRHRAENLEEVRAYRSAQMRRLRAADPEKFRTAALATQRRWRDDNRDHLNAYERQRYAKHMEQQRARSRNRSKSWRAANPGKARAMFLKRRFYQEQRTPLWVDLDKINQIYLACPEEMHVDHIVPLRGITIEGYKVSGLHVPWNLQYLRASENCCKGSRMRIEDEIVASSSVGFN